MRQSTARTPVYEPSSDAARGTRLSSHTDRSGTTVHGGWSVGIGGMFAAVGATVAVLAWLEHVDRARGVPWWIGPIVGGMFAIGGLSFVVHGIIGLRVKRRVRRLRQTHVREPWIWDHPWDDRGSRDDSGRRIARAVWGTGFLGLFLIPFNWIGFFSPDRPIPFTIVAVLMDALLVACVWWMVTLIRQRTKYGPAMLRFRRFPFRVGGEVEVHLARPAELRGVEVAEALLRCVQERYETTGSGDDQSQSVAAYELWSERQRVACRRGEFTWRFAVPAGMPGTALSERPPRYWEMEVRIEQPGLDFVRTFLVPVYGAGRR